MPAILSPVRPVVDLRSDTVTLPSPAMRRAIAEAEVGDDVFGEDPTVNRLQEVAAERLGKQDALFIPSGTMGNLLGMLVNAQRGQEVIVDALSHVLLSEAGGTATLGGIQLRTVETEDGILRPADVAPLVRRTGDVHQPTTAAISVENTHNRHGGNAWSLDELTAIAAFAEYHQLAVHMDGARIFNACLAVGADVKQVAAAASTVTFCFSKGLGCPAGSMLCGPHDKIGEARRWRKMLGGSMRQVGILASAGLYAMDNMIERLAEDHINARILAEGLASIRGLRCDSEHVRTNIVFADLLAMSADQFIESCAKEGVRIGQSSARRVRMVTHYGVDSADMGHVLAVIQKVVGQSERHQAAS